MSFSIFNNLFNFNYFNQYYWIHLFQRHQLLLSGKKTTTLFVYKYQPFLKYTVTEMSNSINHRRLEFQKNNQTRFQQDKHFSRT